MFIYNTTGTSKEKKFVDVKGCAEAASKEEAPCKEVAATEGGAVSREVAIEDVAPKNATSDTDSVSTKSVPSAPSNDTQTVNTDTETVKPDYERGQITDKQVDRLERLAQQIEDFDPVAILSNSDVSKASSVSSEFTRDINDEKLIDELVESGNGRVDGADKNRNNTEREVTPGNDSEEDNSANNVVDTDSTVISKAEDHQQANGCESEEEVDSNGIEQEQDDDGEADNVKNKQDTIKTDEQQSSKTDEKPAKQGDKSQKQEHTSPTKSGRSKRKEDKSIGKFFFFS